jgi:hypothetical protein
VYKVSYCCQSCHLFCFHVHHHPLLHHQCRRAVIADRFKQIGSPGIEAVIGQVVYVIFIIIISIIIIFIIIVIITTAIAN